MNSGSPLSFRFVLVGEIQPDFVGVLNKTIIPLALVGYEMIIANSYPTRPRGIIIKYNIILYYIISYHIISYIILYCIIILYGHCGNY